MANRPRIGITMRLEADKRRFYLGRDYSEAIEAFGGIPLHIGLIPDKEYISQAMDGLDGILLPGSDTDVDPIYYGEEPHHRLGSVVPEKDETDRLILDECERRGTPVLAICYGMQALNVWRGGSLIQDIESQVENSIKHEQGFPQHRNSHSIRIEDGSFISKLGVQPPETGSFRVNSSHHQSINELGRDLRAVAWASDGVIEAIEDTRPDRYVVGVQWHPELTAKFDDLSKAVFAHFVQICRTRVLR